MKKSEVKIKPETENPFELNEDAGTIAKPERHVYGEGIVCCTDSVGTENPKNKSLFELRVDASAGFIPLWTKGVTLKWRFGKTFDGNFKNPEVAKTNMRKLMGEAIDAWGDACPIKFKEDNEVWDFEVLMKAPDCDSTGCVLASAFFPEQGQNKLYIYKTMFEHPRETQVKTLEHEFGHVFGLRHFFANIKEKQWASQLFGKDSAFTIMNYGPQSQLTDEDKSDLKKLYELIWSGQLTEINGTEIKLFKSYSMA